MAPRRTQRSIPCVLMRAGTSKGLFMHRATLPGSQFDWSRAIVAAMGSCYGDPKQIDGLGGGSSVTSKVAVIGPSAHLGIDVDYTFIQVAVGEERIDLSGNCGNMVSGVGPFALQEGLVSAEPGAKIVDVRILNTNTNRVIVETIEVDETGAVVEDGACHIPGVAAPGAPIRVAFVEPQGSMTGKMFPTDRVSEEIEVSTVEGLEGFTAEVTIVDCANPFVLIDSRSLPTAAAEDGNEIQRQVVEAIRCEAAVRMGLASTVAEAGKTSGTPKAAILAKSAHPSRSDIRVTAYSMGKLHPSLQLTGGVCLAAAACVENTIPHRLKVASCSGGLVTPPLDASELNTGGTPKCTETVRLEHSRGVMEMDVARTMTKNGIKIERVTGIRTARRLFEGNVLFYT
ncbi:methylitaconate delta2-delta3-isomerase [Cordyceps fumosorosea ARSEF 2679]|uniref:Methylitaconate delta2-delta3-isomerase n=1 Tax=Cordyceps fumosorosea (strain ARSEF 2679) TaxID=1081104 RepID=A0A167S8L6_CORFA|nr:methylitaconate delta2-delta3-isomerase [Cordyceps fumosorosea ARSEF 2679]OAA59369.1 methylitaconate delta2-delta3-isomerase [Cordyceps fumosorosea ARSEF 2679]